MDLKLETTEMNSDIKTRNTWFKKPNFYTYTRIFFLEKNCSERLSPWN